ncbi:MAG: hypothetical protein KatS3mg015_2453 [Fimbriimonadales bacterium]|nr:MAG: hypothetical protein KatS3mg015_2453 [Fimbriimonadales bacterium]
MSVRVYIDGNELTVPGVGGTAALSGSVTRRLNRPSEATVTVPMDLSTGGAGSRLKVVINSELWFHGFVTSCETDTGEDEGQTVYNAIDPLELWAYRPVRDYDGLTPGNFVDPYILRDKKSGPQIIEAMLKASENPALIPTAAEGPTFLEFGFFETGGSDLSGAPVDWPITMAELASLLTSTGELDIILTPIDSGGNMARIDCYNGAYGSDLSASVVFEYGQGARNVRRLRWTEDLTIVANKIQTFFGPKETTRRYKSNITADDPCLPVQLGSAAMSALLARRSASQAAYGVRMEIQEFDVDTLSKEQEPLGTCAQLDPVKLLFRRQWYQESWIRSVPRTIVHITPVRGVGVGSFDIGDLVGVAVAPSVRGGFMGKQRVYGYSVSWDEDSVLEVSEIETSADQEGA